MPKRALLVATLAGTALCLARDFNLFRGGAAPAGPPPAPVLLITIDTLRADRLGCYGSRTVRTPAMDALAAQGVRFENALTQVPITFPAHTVILTGTYPMWNGVRDFTSPPLSPKVGLISEAFERHHYATAAFVSAFVLDSSWGLARGFQTYDDRFDPRQFETRNPGNIQRRADETIDHLLAWLQQHQPAKTGRPFFVWLHLYDPHSPYDPPEPFHTRYAGHLYDGEVAYTDSQLGRLFNAMRNSRIYDRTLIVLLADHGESLGEHGEAEHGFFVYRSTLRVPLIVKPPAGEAEPRAVARPVGTIDVAPTVLDLAGLRDPLSRQFQGSSLAAAVLGKGAAPDQPVYSESYYPRDSFGWSELRAVSNQRYQFIRAPHPELYDWSTDPGELHNLEARQRALAASLGEQMADVERRYSRAATAENGPELSPETVEKLRSLGYVGYSAPATSQPSESLPDPKDRLGVYKAILRAEDLSAAGHLADSNRTLESVVKEEPKLYLIPFMLAENASRARQWPEAQKQFLACLKLNPTFDQAIMGLARAYLAEDKASHAEPWLELAIHQNPHNFLAYHALGLVALEQRNLEEAQREFSRAAAEKPDYAPSQQQLGITLVEMRRYAEAIAPLARARQLDPSDPVAANFLGTAYANVGKLTEAVAAYGQALRLKSDYAGARLNLAFAYLKLGERDHATREFHTVCSQNPQLCQQYRRLFE